MGLFDRKKKQEVEMPKPNKEELLSMAELMFQGGGLSSAINASIQKQVDASVYYQAYENADDQGNYFGTEFNIRATSGRIKRAYALEPWMYTGASLIARTLNTVSFVVKNKVTGEIDENHPLNKKMTLGNRLNDYKTTNWTGSLDLILGGNFFRAFNETYTEYVQIPVEKVSIKLSADRKQIEYLCVYDDASSTPTMIPYKQVVHHKYPNPYNPFYGMSIFTAASRPILLDRYKNEFEMAFYLRGATNSGVIECTEDINKSRMNRLMQVFEAVYTGKRNWWRTIFLPKGAKWVDSGLTMSEMQHLEGLRENRLSLLAVLGIPPSQVGIVQDVNRSTSEVQERNFWNNTIKPMAEFMAEGWNNSYLVKVIYGGSVIVEPDFSNVEALQGSLITQGEQAKSIENFFWIDEIRQKVFGEDPLPNNAGQKFVAEIKSSSAQAPFSLAAPTTTQDPIAEVVASTEETPLGLRHLKAQVVSNQERIESKLSDAFLKGYQSYLDLLLKYAEAGLRDGEKLSSYLAAKEESLAREYMKSVEVSLQQALDRGFSFATNQAKVFQGKIKTKQVRFNETDRQAIDALKEEQRDGQRIILAKRSIDRFIGMNKTRTQEVLDIVANETEDGKTLDQIAATIRTTYGETYKNQAFTVARTELLTAVSQGIKWNHEVLGEVFSDVQKQWFHVGDVGSNPDARDNHAGFEDEGPVPKDYKWGGVLDYPRDPTAEPGETINCRCSMVSVIPDDATSNAEVILDRI